MPIGTNGLIVTHQCEAVGPKGRCKHLTSRCRYCWQHELKLNHFSITPTDTWPKNQWGLITTQRIPVGQAIAQYDGPIVPKSDLDNPFLLQIGQNRYIDGARSDPLHEGRFIKASKHPNAEFVLQKNKVYAYAKTTIPEATEITAKHAIVAAPLKEKKQKRLKPLAPRKRITDEEVDHLIGQKYPGRIFENMAQKRRFLTKSPASELLPVRQPVLIRQHAVMPPLQPMRKIPRKKPEKKNPEVSGPRVIPRIRRRMP